MTIALAVRMDRASRDINQMEYGKLVGLSPGMVSLVELGTWTGKVSIESLLSIGKVAHIPASAIVEEVVKQKMRVVRAAATQNTAQRGSAT